MSWQTGNLARAQNTREALNSASQIKQRGIDNFFKGTQQLQNVGLQMGQWKQNEKAQYRDEWAKLSAKDPNTPPFEEWYPRAKGKNSGFNIMDLFKGKSENIGTTDTSVTPGSGYETRFQQMMMDYKTLQGEKEWENYKRTLEKETGIKFEDRPFEEQKQLRLDHERGRAAVGYGHENDIDKSQGINNILDDGFRQFAAWNQKQEYDEMGNLVAVWKNEPPTKEQITEALYTSFRDDPRITGLLGTDKKYIKARIKEWVEGRDLGLAVKKEPAAAPVITKSVPAKIEKIKKIPEPFYSKGERDYYELMYLEPPISIEADKLSSEIVDLMKSVNKNPEKYQKNINNINILADRLNGIKKTGANMPKDELVRILKDMKKDMNLYMLTGIDLSQMYKNFQ